MTPGRSALVRPVRAAVDRLRPATSAEALAMQFTHDVGNEPGHPKDQEAFIDSRSSLPPQEDDAEEEKQRQVNSENITAMHHDVNEDNTLRSLVETEFERGNTPTRAFFLSRTPETS